LKSKKSLFAQFILRYTGFGKHPEKTRSIELSIEARWYRQKKWRYAVSSSLGGLALYAMVQWPNGLPQPAEGPSASEQTLYDSLVFRNPPHARPLKVMLPDGSRVTIAPGSCLRYLRMPDGRTRETFMSGQAVFDVAKDNHKPFIVHTSKAQIQVLGTCFNVRSYEDDATATVTLISGKVQVAGKNNMRYLNPGQQARIKNDQIITRMLNNPESCLAWTNEKASFNFENEELETVLREIARRYEVKISNPKNLCGIRMTGTISQNKTLDDLLSTIRLAESGAIYLKRIGDTIYVTNP